MASEEAARIIDLYQRKALDWVESRASASLFEKPWLDRFRALLPPAAPILDIGCGSAEPMAGYLIGLGHPVVGVDSSPAMIEVCRRAFSDSRNGSLPICASLPCRGSFPASLRGIVSFTSATTTNARCFRCFAQHAAPKAALMFTSGPAHGEAIGSFGGEPLYHASLDPAEYRSLLDRNGFRVVSHVVEDPACGGHTIWLAQLI